ncbi:hypothetical protein [Peteryoungia ipomoeae]|uniref:Uncharacterized protein n=1 Tax=Peteryoungia ipomoeae TaxID=1210932 RepID=A0A4V6T692_9HYPH|nr:hypothetical protein [Peteryoungia ipomoeae]THV25106.1 hypothetical protein FAA97_02575 [Peteryoungia ipomoeae]
MTSETASVWLKLASLTVIALGLIFAAAAHPAGQLPVGLLTDIVFFHLGHSVPIDAAPTRLFLAIGGGVMVGWGAMMWILVTRLMPREPALARLILIEGTLAWFVVDSLGSLASGGYLNIPLNTALMLMIVAPAWLSSGKGATSPA